MKMFFVVILLLAYSAAFAYADDDFVFFVFTDRNDINLLNGKVLVADGEILAVPGGPQLGLKNVRVVLPAGFKLKGITIESGEALELADKLQIDFTPGDIKTGRWSSEAATTPDLAIYDSDKPYPAERAEVIGSGYWSSIHLADLAIYPVAYRPLSGKLLFYPEIKIRFHLRELEAGAASFETDPLAYDNVSRSAANGNDLRNFAPPPAPEQGPSVASEPPPQYLLVTSREIAPGFAPFITWKNQKGVAAEIAYIDDILSSSPGVDPAEKLRNYLIGAHAAGVKWVLLGGDEDVVPIRYLYAGNINDSSPHLTLLQIGDIYYSDLTGDWTTTMTRSGASSRRTGRISILKYMWGACR